jgi:hypothetical protein
MRSITVPIGEAGDRLRELVEEIELWHTNTILEKLADFPHHYFRRRLNR